jgi:hypothetical protein
MINLYTPSEELWNTLSEEHFKAKYWMIKQFGGEKRYEAMRDGLLRRCAYGQHSMASDVIYYTSGAGNHWICFENATYYPDAYGANSRPTCFCYYETASSLGLFMPGFNAESEMNSVLIFTPHFFQRYAERMGIEGDKKELLLKFATSSSSFAISPMDTDDNELEKIVVRLSSDCTGHGIRRSGDRNVFEIRTILTDTQLSKAQSARTERARNFGDVVKYEPTDVAKRRLELSANPLQEFNDKMDKLHSVGVDTSRQEECLSISFTISQIFMKMGIASIYDIDFWDRYNEVSHDPIVYFFKRREEQGKGFMTFKELVATARDIAARMGIRKFAWREFAFELLVVSYKFSESKALEIVKSIYK